MLMGFPADMAVVLVEKARDDDAKVAEAAERGKKALAERVAAARTVGTRRERASISLDELRSTVGGGAGEDLYEQFFHVKISRAAFSSLGSVGSGRLAQSASGRSRMQTNQRAILLDEGPSWKYWQTSDCFLHI